MTSSAFYTNHPPPSSKPYPPSGYHNLDAHDVEVLRSRAISPNVAAQRGIRTEGSNMVIPLHNTQGESELNQKRPHTPSIGPDGKERKYLFEAGARMIVDVTPASQPYLTDVRVPIIITESALKADAIQSAIEPGQFCVMSISGVYGWRSAGMPLSDFGDIPWRSKERDRITFRRTIYLIFDSDTATNPTVARARWEMGQYLRRRGARVGLVDVPTDGDGGKQGIDDYRAGGGDLHQLLSTAYPLPDIMPASGAVDMDSDRIPEIDRLRQKVECLQRDNATLVQLIKNPNVQAKTKAVVVSIYTQAASKQSRGQIQPDGRIRLEARHIANDHRPIPERGQPRDELNPLDESRPIVARSNVVSITTAAADLGLIKAEPVKERKQHKNGTWYWDTELVIEPPTSLAEFLQPIAAYTPTEPGNIRKPYTYQNPCPSCGEVHARTVITTRKTYCGTADDVGCGDLIAEREITVSLPVSSGQDPNATDEERAALERQSTPTKIVRVNEDVSSTPSAPPRSYVSTKNVRVDDETPADVISTKNVDPGFDDSPPPGKLNTCVHCGDPTPTKYRCTSCIAEAERLNQARWEVAS